MIMRKTVFNICWAASVLFSALGYHNAGLHHGSIAVLFSALAWIFIRNRFCAISLVLSVGIAAAGILLGASTLLMFSSAGAALAAWDQEMTGLSLEGKKPADNSKTCQKTHLYALFFALALGFSVIFLGRTIHLPIPFFGMVFFAGLIIFSINRIFKHLQQKGK